MEQRRQVREALIAEIGLDQYKQDMARARWRRRNGDPICRHKTNERNARNRAKRRILVTALRELGWL